MNYVVTGKGRLFDLFGDFVVFRNMKPVDDRVPPVSEVLTKLGLPPGRPPRKREPGYGRAAVWLLGKMHDLQHPGATIEELLFIGDTSGDLKAFREISRAGDWKGAIFLGKDGTGKLSRTGEDVWKGDWAEISRWLDAVRAAGLSVGERTVAVIDIDKTAIGARGRNHAAIDKARMEAMRIVISEALGDSFDQAAFLRAYEEVNQSRYHDITEDNQDYIAYTCLVMSSGIISLEEIRAATLDSRFSSFRDFFEMVDEVMKLRPQDGLRAIHESVAVSLAAGDPTPFKAFRREELKQTVARMDMFPDGRPVEELLEEEICITGEVWEAGIALKERGVVLTSFSDKPDEASVPMQEENTGAKAVHEAVAKIVSAAT